MNSVSVIIATHSKERYADVLQAVESIQKQTLKPLEIIVGVDNNPELAAELEVEFGDSVQVLSNIGPRGLSENRNNAIDQAKGDIIAFMDDDAFAEPDWLENLLSAYTDDTVAGVGGRIVPEWLTSEPRWFPGEFYWIVGSTYLGTPEKRHKVRNLIGANMSFRREVFENVGKFRTGVGRVDALPIGCEETEICIRMNQFAPHKSFIYEPTALVHHKVPGKRATFHYFRYRCYFEGISKAMISRLVGSGDALSSERAYTLRILPVGVIRGFGDTLKGDFSGIRRSAAIIVGLGMTAFGYLRGRLRKFDASQVRNTWKRQEDKTDIAEVVN